MAQSSLLALGVATAVLQQLRAVLALATAPCLTLSEQIACLTTRFLSAPITPAATLDFEKDLRRLLDESRRLVVEAVFNHIEPENPQNTPKHIERDCQDYCRKNGKSRTRGGIATLFGIIQLQRCLYEPLAEARHDAQRSFS